MNISKPSKRQLTSITLYTAISLLLFVIFGSIDNAVELYKQYLLYFNQLPFLAQNALVLLAGAIIGQILISTGSYYFDVDISGLKVEGQKGWSVVRASTLLVTIIFIVRYQLDKTDWLETTTNLAFVLTLLYLGICIGKFNERFQWLFKYLRALIQHPSYTHKHSKYKRSIDSSTETPITSVLDDKFQREPIANNLMEKLIGHNGATGELRRIALVGGFGAGKTSTLNLLQEKLGKRNELSSENWVCVSFDAWGKADNTANIQGLLLQDVVSELSKHIETSSVQNLPEQYLHAFKDIHHSTKIISYFLSSESSPATQLARLDSLLRESNLKVCIFIEDMDRNNDIAAAVNSLGPLLDNLKSLMNLSFIFTIGYGEKANEIISRVTDYKLELPALDFKEQLKRLTATLRSPEITLFYEANNHSWGLPNRQQFKQSPIPTVFINDIFAYASSLISSARDYATIERTMRTKWHELKGELNYDDLLLLTILEVSAPIAHEFICNNIECLIKGNHEDEADLDTLWEGLEVESNGLNRIKLKKIVEYIFPQWSDTNSTESTLRLQSVARSGLKNYWKIYLTPGYLNDLEFSDQALFSRMLDFQSKKVDANIDSFIDRMVGDPSFVSHVGHIQSAKSSFFTSEFWPEVLAFAQKKSEFPLKLMDSTGTQGNNSLDVATSLILIVSFINFKYSSLSAHVEWAFENSFTYLMILFERTKNKKTVKEVLKAEVEKIFISNTINKQKVAFIFEDANRAACFLEIVRPSLLNKNTEEYEKNIALHKALIKLLNVPRNKFRLEIYETLLRKPAVGERSDFTSQSYTVLDREAYSLLNNRQKKRLDKLILYNAPQSQFTNIYHQFKRSQAHKS
ncbi:hypothetical protein W04_3556 [Pseudoalteromonas sp. SW0106-04]|uniref:P-loop NTPase fold protein n=1 Tax=Pseudoalteromonas sp. SW0106-04 TaxID=1702169 RepID=UPI0006B5C2B0|nr:P-loop NTPase fold protein [Pseudoalteromonas sp. SW0106-04]GAP76977.1 hypothetical protein W04_3556 [Pseudoalteromonas sp. SW0106-04]